MRDLDGTCRRGTLEDLENFIKLAYHLPALNHSGGIVCEPQDVPVPKRHLEIFRAQVRHSDMPFMGAMNAPERAMDCVEMARIVFGGSDAGERTVLVDGDTLALDAIRDVGPSGHFFGHDHTIEHYGSAFYRR